ncbi:putative secreted protein [Ixodes scapularis]
MEESVAHCAVNGISDLNLGSQLYLIEGALTFLLERAGLGLLADAIQGLCKLSLLDCSGFSLDNEAICAEPIVLNFPTALGLGKCVGDMAEVCIEGNPATDTLVKSIFDFLTCTVENVFSNNVGSLLTDLVCSLLNIILRDLGQLSGPFQVVVNTIETVLGLRYSQTLGSLKAATASDPVLQEAIASCSLQEAIASI